MNNANVQEMPAAKQPKEKKPRKKLTGKQIRRIVILSVLAVVIVVVVLQLRSCMAAVANYSMPVETVTLQSGDLVKSVNVTGTVESRDSEKIYSKLSGYPVEQLLVEVGDTVEEGDVLAVLDTAELENTIAQQRALISTSRQSSGLSLDSAQRKYEFAKDVDYDQQILDAESAIREAERAVDTTYNEMRVARYSWQDARVEAGYSRRDGETEEQDEFYYGDNNVSTAKKLYDNAKLAYDSAVDKLERAQEALEYTKSAAAKDLADLEDSVESAQVDTTQSEAIRLQKLEMDLQSATITAPVGGTVTAVYADQGAVPTGLMFVIEDTEQLQISAMIKEYEIADVKVGQKVQVKSDATGDDIFEGVVSKISPTSVKNAAGDNTGATSSADAEFEIWIDVITPNSGLFIGTKARLTIIVEEKENVFTVPYEAITYDAQGNEVVYIPVRDEEGGVTVQPVVIETGLENDFSVEISAPELDEGQEILSEAQGLTPGMPVTLMSDYAAAMAQAQGAAQAGEQESAADEEADDAEVEGE